jgi:hypothetical protein
MRESTALEDYILVFGIFTDLVVRGKMPEGEP